MQQNYDINSPIAGANEASAGQETAMNQAVGLAKSAQDVQQKQLETQQMEDKLSMGRAQSLIDRVTTQNKIGDPRLRQSYAKMNDQWAQKNGLAYPGFFNDHAGDDAQQRLGPLSDILMGSVKSPEEARAALAAASSPEMLDQSVSMLQEQKKQQNQMALANVQQQTKLQEAQMKQDTGMYGADKRLEGMQAMGGIRAGAQLTAANRAYASQMDKPDQALISANKVQKIIQDVDSGELNSNKTIKGEVQKNIAMLLSNGAPSTVYGESAIHQDSYYEDLKNLSNKTFGEADSVIAPAQWEQMKKDINVLQANAADNHATKFEAFRAGMAGHPAEPNLVGRYNTFRKSMGLPGVDGGQPLQTAPAAQTPAPGAATAAPAQAWTAQYKDPVQQKFIQNALSHGYSQSDIEAHLKGGK